MTAIARELPPTIERAVARLVRSFAPEQVILFGSFAKGTTHLTSDVDLLVVAEAVELPERRQRRARQLTADCFPPVDVVFASPEEVATADTEPSPFLASILTTGRPVYRRQVPAGVITNPRPGRQPTRSASRS